MDRRQGDAEPQSSQAAAARRSQPTSPVVGTPATSSTAADSPAAREAVNPDERRNRIEVEAYMRYLERGSAPGAELDDWLAAERQVDGRTD
jgi:hypothetical protein